MFSCIMKLKNGTTAPDVVHLGTSDFLVLDGELSYGQLHGGKLGAGKAALSNLSTCTLDAIVVPLQPFRSTR